MTAYSKVAQVFALSVGLFVAFSTGHAQTPPTPVILGYSATWRDASAPPADFDYASLTHIARAFLKPKPDGSIEVPEGYFSPTLADLAREHHVKLLLSFGGGGASASDWLAMATRAESREKFLAGIDALLREQKYDGVDIDWEPPDPSKQDGEAYGNLLKALRSRFPTITITTALPADAYQTRFTPWTDVVANVDYVCVMAYDYSGPWSGVARHASNLHPAGDYKAEPGSSVEEGMQNLIVKHQVPPSKLLLGMNFWAYRFRVDHLGDAFKKGQPNVTDDLSYQQVQTLLATGHYQGRWDDTAKMAYLERTGGGSIVCYESPDSVRRKCDFAKSLNLAGMMIWNIGSDVTNLQAPLMDATTQSFGGSPRTLTRSAIEAQVKDAINAIKASQPAADPAKALEIPSDLTALSLDALEALNSQLQMRAAESNDAHWQAATSAKH